MEFSGLRLPKLILAVGLLAVLAVYSMGWNGTLHFDDEANLNGLYGISDLASGLQFVFSGESGPTGRPLSLATFALQHESWPDPRPFLIFNSLLHILNAVLCFLLLQRLLGWMLEDRRAAEWLSVFVTLVWAASPFLASSNLMVVQRMTGLSAFFALLTLNIYTFARLGYRPDLWRSNIRLAAIAGIGTLLSGLAKENGFLLPVFLLLIEWLLVANARTRIKPLHKVFFWVVLMAPVAVILWFLLYKGLSATGYLYRDFTLTERLLTQPRALFEYIRNLLVPATESITPFHDAYRHSIGLFRPTATIWAVAALIVLIIFAWLIRQRMPIIAFGILFFLAGHLVESTTVPLELYFPHRNYLPAIGLYLAVAIISHELLSRLGVTRWISITAAASYLLVFIAVLGSGSSLWGNRQMSAELWHIHNRSSVRAAIYLFSFYIEDGKIDIAARLNERFISQHQDAAFFAIQSLSICNNNETVYSKKVRRAVSEISEHPGITVNIARAIQEAAAKANNLGCSYFTLKQADALLISAFENIDRASVHPNAKRVLLFARAQLANHRGNYQKAIDSLERAMEIEPSLDAALLITYFYVELGDRRAAIEHLEKIIASPPVGFPNNLVWRDRLKRLLQTLD